MGVNHLRRDAAIGTSQAAQGHTTRPQSQQFEFGPNGKRPAQTSGTRQVPSADAPDSFSDSHLHAGHAPAQPPKHNDNGGRAGGKSGQAKVGETSGNKKGMSGGRLS